MNQPRNDPPTSSNSNKTLVIVILVLMGLGILLLTTLIAFPSLAFLSPATQTQPFPTLFFPTSECGAPTLLIGSTTFQIRNASLSPYGTVRVPPDTNGVAYHVEGAGLPYSFLLSPTQENIAFLTSLPKGTTAKATSINCHSMNFALSAPQPGSFSINFLLDQSPDNMILFVQTDAAGHGLIISSGVVED
jgi:hypothetical protein